MTIIFNTIYIIALIVLSPYLIYKSVTTGKYRRGLWRKLTGRVLPKPFNSNPSKTIWFHGVSVGEIVMLQTVVTEFRRTFPDWRCVVSTTTDTGIDEALKRFPDLTVIHWPFDFSWAVRKALSLIHPRCVVLAESEMWPNFVRIAKRRGVQLALINGRMSPRSAKRFRALRWLVGPTFRRIDLCAAQTADIGGDFEKAGVPTGNIVVTGSVKYDGAVTDRDNRRTNDLRRLLQIGDRDLVWVAGSTQAPEERIVLDVFGRVKKRCPSLRLVIVPRQKDRFDEVAQLLRNLEWPFVRRSDLPDMADKEIWRNRRSNRESPNADASGSPIILVDTIGELSAIWGMADIAYVGGSMDGNRGGQNMIEPAAFGAAVLFGPHTWNFRDTVRLLLSHDAAMETPDADELERRVKQLIGDESLRRRLGDAAKRLVARQQGATLRTIAALGSLLDARTIPAAAA